MLVVWAVEQGGDGGGVASPAEQPADPLAPRTHPDGQNLRRATLYTSSMTIADYKVVLYCQLDGSWVAEVPAIGGCYALMNTRDAALTELRRVFQLIADEHAERGQVLPVDTTQIVHA